AGAWGGLDEHAVMTIITPNATAHRLNRASLQVTGDRPGLGNLRKSTLGFGLDRTKPTSPPIGMNSGALVGLQTLGRMPAMEALHATKRPLVRLHSHRHPSVT